MLTRRERTPLRKLMLLGAMAGAGALVEDMATGNPLTFITDKAKPLKSLLIPFSPIQQGTGDPSPSNIRSIIPWNGLTVFGGGMNLFDETVFSDGEGITLGEDGFYYGKVRDFLSAFSSRIPMSAPFKDGAKYYVSYTYYFTNVGSYTGGAIRVAAVNKDGTTTNLNAAFSDRAEPTRVGMATSKDVDSLKFTLVDGRANDYIFHIKDFQVEVGTTASAYEEYRPITETDIVFPSAVYGGTLDVVSGVLTVEYAEVILKGTEEWFESENKFFVTSVSALKNNTAKQNIFCDLFKYSLNGADYLLQGQFTDSISSAYNVRIRKHDDAMTLQEFKGLLASNNMHIVYKLETPQEQTLTGHQLTALIGNNTIWSDADGSMTAVYLKKG